MQRSSIIQSARPLLPLALCAVFATASMHAQRPASALLATPATTPPVVSQPASQPPQSASPVTYGIQLDHPPAISYTAGSLSVVADGASLNQILREISRTTGMKVTGGVNDERVFGTYGPDAPAKVLSALLDGTGSNILIVQGTSRQNGNDLAATPVELVLTPRHGGPTPPNPNPQPFNNAPRTSQPSQPVAPSFPIAAPTPPPGVSPTSPPPADPVGAAATGVGGASSSSDSTQQQSPNGVKTPQQIYEQLQQIRQLQQQQQQMQQH